VTDAARELGRVVGAFVGSLAQLVGRSAWCLLF
jgi:hypothetical protein